MAVGQNMPVKLFRNVTAHFLLKAKVRSLVFFLLMALCIGSKGQGLFYVESKLHTADHKPLSYRILLKMNYDGSAAARITFKDPVTGKKRLIRQSYVDNDFPDNSYLDSITYLMPFGNAYAEDDAPEKNFVTPRFQFKKTKTLVLADGKVNVFYSYNNQQWFLPDSNTVQEESYQDLVKSKAFVQQFYKQDDPFYKGIFHIKSRRLTAAEARSKIFLLAIAATNDPQIGITTQIDLQNIRSVFATNADNWRIGFQYQEISGGNYTKKAVDDAIDHLKPRPNDIVIVYYSGHGYRYSNDISPFPRMALVANPSQNPDSVNLRVEDIYNRILKKGARVNIVLADCCNENYGAAPPLGPTQPFTAPMAGGPPTLNLDNFRALFLPSHPLSVLACAAEKNQLAAGNDHLGGFFTSFVVSGLVSSLYGDPWYSESSWTMILNNAREYTRRQALTAPCNSGPCDGDRSLQRPEFKVIAESNRNAH